MVTRNDVVADLIEIVRSLAADWDYEGEIEESTRLFTDMNWQSVDMVVLAHEISTHYARTFAFADFFEGLRARDTDGLTIAELADFVFTTVSSSAPAPVAG